jgi:LysM repeat protein
MAAKAIAESESALTLEGHARDAGLREGYAKLCPLLEGPLPMAEREQALAVFHKITGELFLSPIHNEFAENYVVKSGDSFAVIAHRAGISLNLLYDLNNKPRGITSLHAGDNLKLPKGRPAVIVRKADFTASLYFGDQLVRQYVIAHGKGDNTPEGQTTITSKTMDPEKSSRGARDPVNEMRLRWMGLDPWNDARTGQRRNGIGFHGTIYPDSIGKMESLGCIRMRDADVIELYDIVREGNKVEIRA